MAINKEFMITGVYWALYLALTMLLFEKINLTPISVGGFVGWLFVEFGRVIVGFFLFDALEENLFKRKEKSMRGRE